MVVSDVEVILRALSLHAAFTAPLKGGTQADAETYLSLFRSFSGAEHRAGLGLCQACSQHLPEPSPPLRLVPVLNL